MRAVLWGHGCAEQLHALRPGASPAIVDADMWRAGAMLLRFLWSYDATTPDAEGAVNIMLRAYARRWQVLSAEAPHSP